MFSMMKTLIVYATRYGATAGTAEEIAKVLREEGFDVKVVNAKEEKIKEIKGGRLRVPVTTLVPAQCMGSGLGSAHVAAGDYDVMTSDPETVRGYGLDKLKFGDFVTLLDHDNSYGRAFVKGAVSIGVVVHSDCLLAGHGPGISTLMTCPRALIEPVIDPDANIAGLLKIGTRRKKAS